MRHMVGRVLAAVLIGMTVGASAAEIAAGKQLFIQPVSLRGTLGDAPIQVNLRTKEEYEDGVEGNYFFFGQSQIILLAGEIEGDEFALEESENGTDVSGQWNGKLAGDSIVGEWQSADGKTIKPFRLKIVRSGQSERPEKGLGAQRTHAQTYR